MTTGSPCFATSASRSATGSSLPSSGPPAAARRPCSACSPDSTCRRDGSVTLDGDDLGELREDERAQLRGEKVGFVFQSFQLIPTLTALENVQVPLELRGDDGAPARARELLARVGLGDRTHHFPTQLSGGEQQRVAIARAFSNSPAHPLRRRAHRATSTARPARTSSSCSRSSTASPARRSSSSRTISTLAQRAQRIIRLADGVVVSDAPARRPRSAARRRDPRRCPRGLSLRSARRSCSPRLAREPHRAPAACCCTCRPSRSASRRSWPSTPSRATCSAVVREQARAMLGGDVSLTTRQPTTRSPSSTLLDSLERTRDAGLAQVSTFSSMALRRAVRDARGSSQVRAVTAGYPFYGEIVTAPAGRGAAFSRAVRDRRSVAARRARRARRRHAGARLRALRHHRHARERAGRRGRRARDRRRASTSRSAICRKRRCCSSAAASSTRRSQAPAGAPDPQRVHRPLQRAASRQHQVRYRTAAADGVQPHRGDRAAARLPRHRRARRARCSAASAWRAA